VIDLRSDTITQPTQGMRAAMAAATVGDDVYGEDPTVNRLEQMVAGLLGKEAALFVPSGTMGNLISVIGHCGRGDEMIVGDQAHIFLYEQGGSAALGGIHPHTVRNLPDGSLDLDEVRDAIRTTGNDHYPVSRLLALENTHNRCGGRALDVAFMGAAGDLAHEQGLQLHVDGARIWNAAVALGVSPARVVQEADSVSVCLSKGLGAPVGSLVVGGSEFVKRARRTRKLLGGGMRQAGVLAAAGIVAISEMVDRLCDDHDNARALAEGISRIDGIVIDPQVVQTDIVIFSLERDGITPAQLSAGLREQGVKLNPLSGKLLRAVTNFHVNRTDIDRVVGAFEIVLSDDAGTSAPSKAF